MVHWLIALPDIRRVKYVTTNFQTNTNGVTDNNTCTTYTRKPTGNDVYIATVISIIQYEYKY